MPDVITGNDYLVVTMGQVLLVMGWLGYDRRYAARAGRVGYLGRALLAGGGLLLAVGHGALTVVLPGEPPWAFVVLRVLGMLVGLLLFGSVNLRARILGQWQALPLGSGMVGCAGFLLVDATIQPATFLVLRTVFGLGLVALGDVLWRDTRAVDEGTEPHQFHRLPTTGEVPPADARS